MTESDSSGCTAQRRAELAVRLEIRVEGKVGGREDAGVHRAGDEIRDVDGDVRLHAGERIVVDEAAVRDEARTTEVGTRCAQADAALQLIPGAQLRSRVNVPEMAAVPGFGIDTEALAPMVNWPPWRDGRKDSVTARIPPIVAVPDPDSDTLPKVSNEPFSAAATPTSRDRR